MDTPRPSQPESLAPPAPASTLRGAGRTVAIVAACSTVALGVGVAIGRRTDSAPGVASADAATPAPRGAGRAPARRVMLPPELAERAGIRTEAVARRTVSPTLELVGSVDFDADRVADVGGRISGRVTQIFVRPGDPVRVGQPLAAIESGAIGEAIADYLSSRANATAARAAVSREGRLLEQQLSTARVVEEASADATEHEAQIRGAEQRLLAMGLSRAEISSLAHGGGTRQVVLRAPIAGNVISRDVVLGQTVEATNNVVRVADLTELWVQLDVFERDLSRVRVNDRAEISSETYPGRVFRGVVNHVDATLDRTTRSARVRIEVDNDDLLLRPGQFVTARLRASGGNAREALAFPRRAVIQLEGEPSVFVAQGPNSFEPRTVELGPTDGDYVEVTRGLAAGERVVVDGAFAVKSEMLR